MNKIKISLALIIIFLPAFGCNTKQTEISSETDAIKPKAIDSLTDLVFSMYHNGEKWGKSDSTIVKFYIKRNLLFLNLESHYKSALYENISFISVVDTLSLDKEYDFTRLQNTTQLCNINYFFAEVDYNSDSFFPVDYIAISLTPAALIKITKVDTIKKTISGSFKGIVEDNKKRMHKFSNGIFLNIPYSFKK